ncbi:MAG TPA: hypothetical protein VGY75_01995 [Candidatus Udaeobacter sp.]|jgi:hypothetical protein|nr:hypothetical protein [Candidatus Udaeobacter sp.]
MLPARILKSKYPRVLLWILGLALVFILYTWGITANPPGFYLDESATAYNAYLVSRTGAGEFGPRFPLLFQFYAGSSATYVNPVTIYLLALTFRFLPPSILVARMFAAFWMFAACLLLGLLAKRISGQLKIGIIVAVTALLNPWLFEVGRLVWDAHFSAVTVVIFLFATYRVQTKEAWNWLDIATVAGSLTLLTYGYFSGRVLAPLFALGLVFFATSKRRLIDIIKTWLLYGTTLVPIVLFNRSHPGVLTKRLYEISYIRPGVSWTQTASEFIKRYLEDQSLYALLMTGDPHPRHHVQGSGGAILFATFILAMIGLFLVFSRRWRDPWWRFVLYGLAISIVPGAITNWPFHQLRLMSYAVFLLLLTVPALEWLLAPHAPKGSERGRETIGNQQPQAAIGDTGPSRSARLAILMLLLAATILQGIRHQTIFRRDGPKREFEFDVPYKALYDATVARRERPIYLQNGMWGPAYMDAFWYATIEGRPLSEFVRLPDGGRPPRGAIVISSNSDCQNCEVIRKTGVYLLYRAK